MSGETEEKVSGWTVDTLHQHLLARIADLRDTLRQQIADQHEFTKQQIHDLRQSGQLATGELRDSVRNQAEDHRRMLDERYATQTKALDAAFKAAEQAVAVALANAEKATGKAETAAERRFEAVNEFRGQQADLIATFIPRVEYRSAHDALIDKVDSGAVVAASEAARNADRINALELRLTSRLDVGQGADAGQLASRTERRLDMGQLLTIISVLVAVASALAFFLKK